MAYDFRTPAEKVLPSLSSQASESISAHSARSFENYERTKGRLFNFYMSNDKKNFASRHGIYLSPFPFMSHSHPLSKTIENHLLFDVLPDLLSGFSSFNVLSMKEKKLTQFIREIDKVPCMVNLINRLIDVKDTFRYGKQSNDDAHLEVFEHVLDKSLNPKGDSVLSFPFRSDSVFFLHDELHYWSRENLFEFLNVFSPSAVLATVVFPIELLVGVDYSLWPFVYDFRVHGNKVTIAPDGVFAESYEQSLEMGWLFRASHFIVGDQCYSVDIIKSVGAHHLFSIVKGRREVRTKRIFNDFDSLDISSMLGLKYVCPVGNIRFSFFQKVVVYLKSLKKPDRQSAVAKLRQLMGDDISLTETMFIDDFAERFSKLGSSNFSLDGLFDILSNCVKNALPDFMRRVFTSYKKDRMMMQMAQAKCFEVQIDTVEMRKFTLYKRIDAWLLSRKLVYDLKAIPSPPCDKELFRRFGMFDYHSQKGFCYPMDFETVFDKKAFREQFRTSPILFGLREIDYFYGINPARDRACITGDLGVYHITPASSRLDGALSDGIQTHFFRIENGLVEYDVKFGQMIESIPYKVYRLFFHSFFLYKSNLSEDDLESKRIKFEEEVAFNQVFYENMGFVKDQFGFPLDEADLSFRNCQLRICGSSSDNERDNSDPSQGDFERNESGHQSEDDEARSEQMESTLPEKTERESVASSGSSFTVCFGTDQQISHTGQCSSGIKREKAHEPENVERRFKSSAELGEPVGVSTLDDNLTFFKRKFFQDDVTAMMDEFNMRKALSIGKRQVLYYCQHANFVYGHDKFVYSNSGWPKIVALFSCIAEEMTGIQFNSLILTKYKNGSRLVYHADDEHVYDQHDNPVLTINLSGVGLFSVKTNDSSEEATYELMPGDAILMKEKAQQLIKHSVTAIGQRFSLTFRVQKRSLSGDVGVSSVDRFAVENLKNCCLIDAIADAIKMTRFDLIKRIISRDGSYLQRIMDDTGMKVVDIDRIACLLGVSIKVLINGTWSRFGLKNSTFKEIILAVHGDHIEIFDPAKLNSIRANELDAKKRRVNIGSKMFFSKLVDMIDPSMGFVNHFKRGIDYERLSKLIVSLRNGNTGVISSELFGFGRDLFPSDDGRVNTEMLMVPSYLEELIGDKVTVEGYCILGFAGCGKSKPVQDALNSIESPLKTLLISPRKRLLGDWINKLKSRNVICRTFEAALKENFSNFSAIVLDEITLFPRGFIDLISARVYHDCARYKNHIDDLARLIVLGDPLQASYFNESDDGVLADGSELSSLEMEKVRYIMQSRRLSKDFEEFIEVECMGPTHDFRVPNVYANFQTSMSKEINYDAILVPSRVEKGLYQNFDNVMTYGESQGLTFDNIIVVISENTLACSDQQCLVALTRARCRVDFINECNYSVSSFMMKSAGKIIGKFMQKKKIKMEEFKFMMNIGEIEFVKRTDTMGRLEHEEKLQGDPWMKGMMSLLEDCEPQSCEPVDIDESEPKIKVHLPIVDKAFAFTILDDQLRAKELREHRMKDKWSNQFKDDDRNLNLETSSGPVNFEAIFPRHRSDDDVTFWMAVKKRLRFSNPITEAKQLNSAWTKGRILFNEFRKNVPIDDFFRNDLMEKALSEFERVRMSKSAKLLEVHNSRSDPDWSMNKILLFMKSQLCKKEEKAFCDAKAGQTLACFAHKVLFTFSKWSRYAELKIEDKMPSSFYIHSRKNFDKMETWVKRNYIGPICVESDYEAFDSSQDATILAFELIMLKHIGWPDSVIEEYKQLKLNLGCKLGNLAIMRFTGEFGTFFFNTMANMAFTFCRYNVNKLTPMCFAGDDMCILAQVTVRSEFNELLDSLRLKAKVKWTAKPVFCGWVLSEFGILKLPSLIYHRIMIAKEKGNLRDCIDSYMIEASYAYLKGENVYKILDETQIDYHQLAIRNLVKHKHMMRGLSASLLEEILSSCSE